MSSITQAAPIPLSRPTVGAAERAAVDRVLRSGQLAGGIEVERFEASFADHIDVGHGIATSNGTSALWLSLLALGVLPGDEVIVPSFTFAATANAVRHIGATPVFADIDPVDFSLSVDTIEPLRGDRTTAVIAVHLYGNPGPVDQLRAWCDRHSLALVEDAAQSHGASLHGTAVGAWGHLAAFSFYPTKNMTTGEGGMVTTDDSGLAAQLRLLRNHGMANRYEHLRIGTNERMTDIAAAMGRVQLTRLERWNERRRQNAARLDAALPDSLVGPTVLDGARHVFNQYTVRTADRSAAVEVLDAHGIGHGIYYPIPCHRQPAFCDHDRPHLPESDRAAAEVLSLPVRPDLTALDLERISTALACLGEQSPR